MATTNLKQLINNLDDAPRTALLNASHMCFERGNYHVEIEHWIMELLRQQESNFYLLLVKNKINLNLLYQWLQQRVKNFKTGNTATPGFSVGVIEFIKKAWLITTLEFKQQLIKSEYLLIAFLNQEGWGSFTDNLFAELENVNIQNLVEEIKATNTYRAPFSEAGTAGEEMEILSAYTINLTDLARKNRLDPVIGREKEVQLLTDILLRRRQNNPILVGEAGVGKTAIVEAFAQNIVNKTAPAKFHDVILLSLDVAALQAGATMQGELAKRIKHLTNSIKKSKKPIILFIDEAHIFLNSQDNTQGANLLKPLLARGELKTIAATTWHEYKKYIEHDAALTRRFQIIKVNEPDLNTSEAILRSLVSKLEHHHQVSITNEAITAAVMLSDRYITNKQLPDKAVSLLDTACANVHLSQTNLPLTSQQIQTNINNLKLELEQINNSVYEKQSVTCLKQDLQQQQKLFIRIEEDWNKQKLLVDKIQQLKAKNKEKQKLNQLLKKLKSVQKENPYVKLCVDKQIIAEIVSQWTGVPLGKMLAAEVDNYINLKNLLTSRIYGQNLAIDVLAKQLQISGANIQEPNKPRGVFLLVGSSGVGKTETALALADLLYGGPQNLITINMSEFKEPHKISMLTGSPPGYVGYGTGGILTEAVKQQPYSVLLLDEIEKAHPSVQEIFYQVFDKGMLKDGEGQEIDFKNTVILMTSNVCSQKLLDFKENNQETLQYEELSEILHPELLHVFKAAFIGRVTVLPYLPLDEKIVEQIIKTNLSKIQKRVLKTHNIQINFSKEIITLILKQSQINTIGARAVSNYLNKELLPILAIKLFQTMNTNNRKPKTWTMIYDDAVGEMTIL